MVPLLRVYVKDKTKKSRIQSKAKDTRFNKKSSRIKNSNFMKIQYS